MFPQMRFPSISKFALLADITVPGAPVTAQPTDGRNSSAKKRLEKIILKYFLRLFSMSPPGMKFLHSVYLHKALEVLNANIPAMLQDGIGRKQPPQKRGSTQSRNVRFLAK
jgi:hypothetical protein